MPDNGQRLTVTNAYGYSEYEPMVSYLSVVDDYGRWLWPMLYCGRCLTMVYDYG